MHKPNCIYHVGCYGPDSCDCVSIATEIRLGDGYILRREYDQLEGLILEIINSKNPETVFEEWASRARTALGTIKGDENGP